MIVPAAVNASDTLLMYARYFGVIGSHSVTTTTNAELYARHCGSQANDSIEKSARAPAASVTSTHANPGTRRCGATSNRERLTAHCSGSSDR